MATYNKFADYAQQLLTGVHNWTAAGNTFKAAIHSDAPTLASDDELADLTQVTGTGYSAGGEDIQNDMTETSGTATVTAVDVTWTASAGDWGAGRYVAIHNDTSTGDKLVCDFDYGSAFTLANGESFTLDFGASLSTTA